MKQILDACCGGKMLWFDKDNRNTLYVDQREFSGSLCDGRKFEIKPDELIDFRSMPYADQSFNLIIFDPPHLNKVGSKSWMAIKYGKLNDGWGNDLTLGFNECWRVLKAGGTLIFKWNETQIKIRDVLACFNQQPLFGHTTTHNLKTHWFVFYKPVEDAEESTCK